MEILRKKIGDLGDMTENGKWAVFFMQSWTQPDKKVQVLQLFAEILIYTKEGLNNRCF